jgi:hypothetical protein
MHPIKNGSWNRYILAGGIFVVPLLLHLFVDGGKDMNLLFSAVVVVFIAGASAVVLMKMFTNEIDLRYLVSEENGQASLSRFQFLFFTFVIAAGYFVVILANLPMGGLSMPEIPPGVLGLIGISGGSYIVAKGIQKSSESGAGASVTKITVTNGGTGYTDAATKVEMTGGGGKGAVAKPIISAGQITEIVVAPGGSGFTSIPVVVISGDGSGATAVAAIG